MSRRTQGTHAYLVQLHNIEEVSITQLQSALKRINDKIYQLESRGLTNSVAFKKYESYANKYGGFGTTAPRGKSEGGRIKLNIDTATLKSMDKTDIKELLAIDRTGSSWGEEKAKAMDFLKAKNGSNYFGKGKLTKSQLDEIVKTANDLGEVHQFIEDNDDIIYDVENATENFVRGNNGELTPQEVDRLWNIREEWYELQKAGEIDTNKSFANPQSVATRQIYKPTSETFKRW